MSDSPHRAPGEREDAPLTEGEVATLRDGDRVAVTRAHVVRRLLREAREVPFPTNSRERRRRSR